MTLLSASRLRKVFGATRRRPGFVAVDDVSFQLDRGQTLALVGESGAGKSTTGRLVLRLLESDSGSITIDGRDVLSLDKAELRQFRQRAQMVFQDPHSSFDPRLPIGVSVTEPLVVHGIGSHQERRATVSELMERVGLGQHTLARYPSQLSGGQLQRAAIARALTTRPKLIVCDEPVSALDVSIQAQVVNLLMDIQESTDVAYLFITHDLALVKTFADDVVVMNGGRVEESGPVGALFNTPQSDYTRRLLDAIPDINDLPSPRSS